MATPARTKAPATADMAAARRRSALYGIDPITAEVPHLGEPRAAGDAVRVLSTPVLDHLVGQIDGSSLAVVLADRTGRLIHRDAPASSTLAVMDGRHIDVGFSLAEPDVGTNGVGTSLETRQPALVVGAEHYLERFQSFTCANAPIVHPISGKVEATVGVVCPVQDTGPLLLSTAMQLSAQIGQLILEQATPDERFLLDQFLRRRRSHHKAIAAVGHGVLIATPAAQRLLGGLDQAELWAQVRAVARHGAVTEADIATPAGPALRLRCHPLFRGGDLGGAAVELIDHAGPTKRARTRRRLGDLVGESDQWQTVVNDALEAARLDLHTLVVGERGTGRQSVAEAIVDQADNGEVRRLDSATVPIAGSHQWLADAQQALDHDQAATVLVRRIDQLPDEVAAALASLVATSTMRVIATTEATTSDRAGLAALLDLLNVLRIDVPPLRARRQDIPPLARHFASRIGGRQLAPRAVAVLGRQRWPGNVVELRQAITSAHAKAPAGPLALQHLPRHIQRDHDRRPLHGLQQQEADAIVAAINSTKTRTEAARQLGISRATLYRRIEAYGLDIEP